MIFWMVFPNLGYAMMNLLGSLLAFLPLQFLCALKGTTIGADPTPAAMLQKGDSEAPQSKNQNSPNVESNKKKQSASAKSASSKRSSIRALTLPSDPSLNNSQRDKLNVQDVCLSESGHRMLTKSELQVLCWDVASGTVIQTFRPAPRKWKYFDPTTEHVFMSPDARFVALYREYEDDRIDVTLHAADSGKVIGKMPIGLGMKLTTGSLHDAFTSNGQYLLIQGEKQLGPKVIYAMSTRTATGGLLRTPGGNHTDSASEILLPHPTEPLFFQSRKDSKPSGITVMNLKTQEVKSVVGPTCRADTLFYDRGLDLSADGNLLLVKSMKGGSSDPTPSAVEVCDWRANKSLFKRTDGMAHFTYARFTPDAKRFVVVRNADYYLLRPGQNKADVFDTIELYDIAGKKRIGRFTPGEHGLVGNVTSIVVSQDGKKLAFAIGPSSYVVDFQTAFAKVEPLPPVPSPKSQYALQFTKEPDDDFASKLSKSGTKPATSTKKPEPKKSEPKKVEPKKSDPAREKKFAEMRAKAAKLKQEREKKEKDKKKKA